MDTMHALREVVEASFFLESALVYTQIQAVNYRGLVMTHSVQNSLLELLYPLKCPISCFHF